MIAGLKLYPTMNDSWVDWFGGVPQHWTFFGFRSAFMERNK